MKLIFGAYALLTFLFSMPALSSSCSVDQLAVQVLGSGGPEIDDARASTSYLIWINGRASILVDTGPGSSVNFDKVGAKFEHLDAVLFTHLHIDHSADFPAYIKGSFFTDRGEDLKVYGPAGNPLMPSTVEFVQRLFGDEGVFPYLEDYVDPTADNQYRILPVNVPLDSTEIQSFSLREGLTISAVPVHHGPVAAIAWRVDIADCSVSFSGDMSNQYQTLSRLAQNSDLLIAHNAIPESASGVATRLHMKPSEIGKIAHRANVKQLIVSHRMRRTTGVEQGTLLEIRKSYGGIVKFAEDLDRYSVE